MYLVVGDSDEMFVDLGLPSGTLWMTKNIGAETDKDIGLYFQFGALQGYEKDSEGLIAHCSTDTAPLMLTDDYYTIISEEDYTLLPEHDCAYYATNGKACLPTEEQWQELWQYATNEKYEDDSGKSWTTIVGPNGKELKLATDTSIWSNGESWESDGDNMAYWTNRDTIFAGQYNMMHIQDYEKCPYLAVPARGVKIQS